MVLGRVRAVLQLRERQCHHEPSEHNIGRGSLRGRRYDNVPDRVQLRRFGIGAIDIQLYSDGAGDIRASNSP